MIHDYVVLALKVLRDGRIHFSINSEEANNHRQEHFRALESIELAEKIALEASIGYIDSAAYRESVDGIEWLDISESEGELKEDLRYVELRGKLIRHPTRAGWVRIAVIEVEP